MNKARCWLSIHDSLIELFSLVLMASGWEADIDQIRLFWKGEDHFYCKFQVEEDVAHQPMLVSEN